MIRTLLIDDHPVVRSGYGRLLEQSGDICVVAECGDGQTGYDMFVQHRPDVSITDLSMSGGSGLDLLKKIRSTAPNASVLIFSMHDSAHIVQRAIRGGALGFVSKEADPECLIAAVREVAAGRPYLSPGISPKLQGPRVVQDDLLETLSPREFEIFLLLVKGFSSAECARLLDLSPKTIANQQTVIKEKLQVTTTTGMVHLALEKGLIHRI